MSAKKLQVVLTSRKGILRIGEAAGSLWDDDVFSRPLCVWSRE